MLRFGMLCFWVLWVRRCKISLKPFLCSIPAFCQIHVRLRIAELLELLLAESLVRCKNRFALHIFQSANILRISVSSVRDQRRLLWYPLANVVTVLIAFFALYDSAGQAWSASSVQGDALRTD